MKIHILLVLIAAVVFKLIFGGQFLYLLLGVTFAYLLGLLPSILFDSLTSKFAKKKLPEIFKTSWPTPPTDAELRKGEIKDLKILVQPDKSDSRKYIIKTTNTGRNAYTNIVIEHRNILLWAENFGLDTTHMPEDMQYAEGAPIHIETLLPNETATAETTGYGTHDQYDLDRVRHVPISFTHPIKGQEDIRYWCKVIVDLPGARRQ